MKKVLMLLLISGLFLKMEFVSAENNYEFLKSSDRAPLMPFEENSINYGPVYLNGDGYCSFDTLFPFYPLVYSPYIDWLYNFKYNRVSGFKPSFGIDIHDDNEYSPNLWAVAGYGFANAKEEWSVGLFKKWWDDKSLITRIYMYDIIGTSDRGILDSGTETMSVVLLRDSFNDYYHRKGVTFSLEQVLSNCHIFTFRLQADEYFNADKHTNWSLIWWEKDLRENPRINEGRINSVVASYTLNLVDKSRDGRDGWLNTISMEKSMKSLNSDFDYTKYVIDIRRYNSLADEHFNLDLEALAGWSDASLPIQSKFYLGGPNPLRGYGFKEFAGDMEFLGRLELVYNKVSLSIIPYNICTLTDMMIFTDIGNVWNQGDYSNYWEGAKNIKTNVGIGWNLKVIVFDVKMELAKALVPPDRGAIFHMKLDYAF